MILTGLFGGRRRDVQTWRHLTCHKVGNFTHPGITSQNVGIGSQLPQIPLTLTLKLHPCEILSFLAPRPV
jgi:hypothetical protein